MGKSNAETAAGGSSGGIGFLFSNENPFRRKAESDPTPVSPQPKQWEASTPGPATERESALAVPNKRRKEKHLNPSPDKVHVSTEEITESASKKKKKKTTEEDDAPRSNRKKRKRREIEEEYEMKKFGAISDGKKDNGGEKQSIAVAVGKKRKAEEAAKETVVREDFDDDSKLLRTVFVGNLPLKTKKKVLLKEFAVFGEIESVRVRSVPIVETKAPRKAAILKGQINDSLDSVHAYIVFKDEQSAQVALGHNMSKVGGNHIRVDMACPPRKKLKGQAPIYSVKKTVFVGNLPYDVKDEELYGLFCEDMKMDSSVEGIRVIRDPVTSLGKGIAYVLFKTREAANTVVKKKGLNLRERELRLAHASKVDANTPTKRKQNGPSTPASSKKHAPEKSSTYNDPKGKEKATSLSYQGLRSSKSGVVKKAPKVVRQVKPEDNKSGSKPKVRSEKRPAVAARKAFSLKRKQEGGTPDNSHRKKARHSR